MNKVTSDNLIKIFEMDTVKSNEFVAEKACEIYFKGRLEALKQTCSYFLQCAETINFGEATPNEVIKELVSIIMKMEKLD